MERILWEGQNFSEVVAPQEEEEEEEGAGQRWHCACALVAGYLRLQTHTFGLCNTHCLSMATMVARTRFNVTLYVHCLSYFTGYNRPAFISFHPDGPQLYSMIEVKCCIVGLKLHFDLVLSALLMIFKCNLMNNYCVVVRTGCSLTSSYIIDHRQHTISNISPSSYDFPHPFVKSPLLETVFAVLASRSS
jgi:hypothetical protein